MIRKILFFLESFTETNIKYLAHGSFWLGTGTIISNIAAFTLSILLANTLSQTDFGIYRYIITFITFVSLTSIPGSINVIQRSMSVKDYMSVFSAIKIYLLGATFSIAITLVAGIYYMAQGNNILGLIFITISPLVFLFNVGKLFNPILSGQKKFKTLSLYSTLTITLSSAIIGAFTFKFMNANMAILAYMASYGLIGTTFSYISIKKLQYTKGYIAKSYKKAFEFTGIKILKTAANHIDQIILWQLIGPTALATYFIAKLPLGQLQGLASVVDNIAFPKIAATNLKTLQKTLPRMILRFGILTIPIIIITIILIPYIMPLLFPKYAQSILPAQMLMPLLLFRPRSIIMTTFMAHQKIKYSVIIITTVTITLSASNYLLIPLYGIYGAVISLYIAQAFNSAASIILLKRIND